MGHGCPDGDPDDVPVEAWVETDRFGNIVAITLGKWNNPDAWITVAAQDVVVDLDGMAYHDTGGGDRVR